VILVVSEADDDHAQAVLERLERRGADTRLLDLSAFPRRLSLSMTYDRTDDGDDDGDDAALQAHLGDLALADCGAVWWRRPQPFDLSPDLTTDVDRTFAYRECQAAIGGLWRTLDADWMNHPTRDEEAARKPYQLRVAQQVGFEIPETCITNDPDRARAFVDEHGASETVYKAFTGTEAAWRETRVFRDGETEAIDAVRHAPVIFQEYVPAGVDLRITVVDGEVFPAAIHAQETAYPVDYRMSVDRARVEPAELPADVLDRLRTYVDRLGLVYGAIDMRRRPDGQHVFLEINPSGQWLFMEERTGHPITETVSRVLAEADAQVRTARH
jgi:glutathione synthase/RimK-type ligase-like ATP-grasp enzyme